MFLQKTFTVVKCHENKHKMFLRWMNWGREISGRDKTRKYMEKMNMDPRRREEIPREQGKYNKNDALKRVAM